MLAILRDSKKGMPLVMIVDLHATLGEDATEDGCMAVAAEARKVRADLARGTSWLEQTRETWRVFVSQC